MSDFQPHLWFLLLLGALLSETSNPLVGVQVGSAAEAYLAVVEHYLCCHNPSLAQCSAPRANAGEPKYRADYCLKLKTTIAAW
jgi:hypothetical protein